MNIIKRLLPISLAILIILVTAGTFFTSADELEEGQKKSGYHLENRSAIQEAIQNADYDTWSNLIGDTKHGEKILEVITEENFEQFAEMHNLLKAGDKEGAKDLAEELGLPKRHMMKKHGFKKFGDHFSKLTDEQKEVLKEAFQSGDREAVKALAEEYGLPTMKNGRKHPFRNCENKEWAKEVD